MRLGGRETAIASVAVVLVSVVSGASPARAAPAGAELRADGAFVFGSSPVRLEVVGANDSLGWLSPGDVRDDDGVNFDRWFSNAMQARARLRIDHELARAWLPRDAEAYATMSLGQVMYTPRSATLASIDALDGDRPYSGWLAGSLGVDVVLPKAPLALSFGGAPFSLVGLEGFAGASGPWSLAGPTQHAIHHGDEIARGDEVPPLVGWNVAETRPSLAFDASLHAETSLLSLGLAAPSSTTWSGGRPLLDVRAGARVDAGAMLLANSVSATVVLGWLRAPLPSGTSSTSSTSSASFPLTAHVYVRGEARAVLYNGTIDGALLDGSVVAASEDLVTELFAGAVLRVSFVELAIAHGWRSNETASLPTRLQTGQWLWHWHVAALF